MLNRYKRKSRRVRRYIYRWARRHSFLWVDYGRWYVGITSNPALRKKQHERRIGRRIKHFKTWQTYSMVMAHKIEKYYGLHGKGMDGGRVKGNAVNSSVFIYVFKY